MTDYDIHSERIEVDFQLFDAIAQAKLDGTPIVAVGTTVTRTLESLPYLWAELSKEEKLKIDIQYKDRRNQLASRLMDPVSHKVSHNHQV
ncbi:MAG: S-adenosylmethionine:tRNA ribosyltransferase-isomerase [Candidatus Peribacteria bacterium]|nr:MAG: S-adenosylmethionine:tRNA ribosyltransferase-isomerase [Candidatus Peribacteria bacterium]